MSNTLFGKRQPAVAAAAILFVVVNNVLAGALVIAAYDFDIRLFAERGALIGHGAAAAPLLRLGGLFDMVGYLAFAPLVLHVHDRLGNPVLAAAGLGFALVGACGATLLGTAGPWLLEASVSGDLAASAARAAFGTIETVVFVGLWAALGVLLLGVWLIGVNWARRAADPLFAYVGTAAGLAALAYAARTGLAGQPPVPITSPIDAAIFVGFGLLPVWTIWLAARLARGAEGQTPA